MPVERAARVKVEARDATGAPVALELEGYPARVVQHELDHLDGTLMLDRTDPESRREALGELRPPPRPRRELRVARIAVAATAPFGADVLERLAERHDVASLLTRPDAPAGRGRRLAAPPAKEVAERLGIPVLQPERPERRARRSARRPSSSARTGCSIPPALLAERTWLNVHPSLLPRWRGAAPVERAIMAGDAETGVTIHETVEELDAGPVAAQEAFPIGAGGRCGRRLRACGRGRGAPARRVLADPRPPFPPQAGEPTYAEKIGPDDRRLDLERPAEELVRVVRAL